MRPTKLTQQLEAQAASVAKSTDNNVEYFTWEEFKDYFALNKAEVIKNPNTGKLFVASGKHRWKCQGDINFDLPMRFLVKDEDYDNACLVNIKET
jgi:hypothetical protein